MAELSLTVERRSELIELLDDDQRLRAEHPKVAEYLDMSPMLPGTGDMQADAGFELRFVHYMTGGESATGNPYWDIVAPGVSSSGGRRVVNGGSPDGSARLAYALTILQGAFAYAIPSPETIAWASRFCGDMPLVDLGAGRGYWAALLAGSGLTVAAYDSEPPDSTQNPSFPQAGGQADVWHAVKSLDDYRPDCDAVLMLCWPPGWGDSMASDALRDFEQAGGQRLIYVGEPKGGKTGDDAFFDGLSARWELASVDQDFVSWWNLSDVAQGWIRR